MNSTDPRFRDGAAYVRGCYVPMSEATIPVTDWGFTRSDAVYDVVHVYQGGFFRLEDHLDRFEHSMRKRRLRPAEDREALRTILHRCVDLAGLTDAYVAMVVSRGKPKIAGSRRPEDCENHLIAYALPWIDVIPKAVQARGASVWIASTPRVPDISVDPTIKNYQWFDLTTGLLEAHDNGFDTAVLCDADGFVTEGPGFNVFAVIDGRVVTPDRGSLHGITRLSVLEICADLGIEASVEALPRASFEDADEVFLATTAGGVMPICRVTTRILANGAQGAVTRRINEAYWRKHAEGWHMTPVLYSPGPAAEARSLVDPAGFGIDGA